MYVINNKIIAAWLVDGTFVGGTVFVSCSSAVVTSRVRRLIRHTAYTIRHILCMAVSYAAGLPALKSVIGVPNSHTDLVCFSVCTFVRVSALFGWVCLRRFSL